MAKAIIKEIILENFMSYRYGRIQLKNGFNFITGPNGAGKSAILLGISLAMGQLNTERSRRLADLVKRGESIGRISLIAENTATSGKRPFPMYNKDEIMISRYIRKDGSYWFEVDYREVSRNQVTELLKKVGIDPDNYLILMPQGVVDEFIMIKPSDKLKMVEEALGTAAIRENLLDARHRLEKILTEESQYQDLVNKAMESLDKWKEEYDKLVMARNLKRQLDALNAELEWSILFRLEKSLQGINERVGRLNEELNSMKGKSVSLSEQLGGLSSSLKESLDRNSRLAALAFKGDEKSLSELMGGLKEIERHVDQMLSVKGTLSVMEYRIKEAEKEIREYQSQIQGLTQQIEDQRGKARGERPGTQRPQADVEEDIRTANAQLKVMGNVDQEAEKIYLEFRDKLDEYRGKLDVIRKNKDITMEEIKKRSEEWRSLIRSTISKVNARYNEIMAQINSSGKVVLENEDDPENAGLRLYASFAGSDLIPLDSFSQSGGELSASVTAFLLAVQTYVVSPFRALDEFDVHMDPLVREKFIKSIYDMIKNEEAQYLVITPNFPTFYSNDIHYIVVQKTQAGSASKVVAR
ncbi:MAG: AAA family ATPase [Nitrososphaerota archaeon]|nr:AAA family ATPase [Nitrososphaerota archaeon]MDG6936557.1 AAA family ATPase [Nitrososphaerota archaeon]MDG6944210.1 AAA family ATPase [Nitrososphaerota archaeon]